MSTEDTKKAGATKRRAAASKKGQMAKANALHEKLGHALRRKDIDAAVALFKQGAALGGAA